MKNQKTNRLVKIAILAAVSAVLMMFQVALPIFPSFYQIDLSELPALIGGFALGPVAGMIICLLKNLLDLILTGTTTGGVGELANFLIGASLVGVASFIYARSRSRKGALVGLSVGIVVMTIVGSLLNYFVLLPLYSQIMLPLEEIIQMGNVINPNITDLGSFILWAVVPFNLLKGTIVSFVTFVFYKKVSPILKIEKVVKSNEKAPV